MLWPVSLAPSAAQADPAGKEPAPVSRKTPEPVRLPDLTRADTGRVADPSTLHGNSKIEGAPLSSAIWQAPAMPWSGSFAPAPSATPATPVPIDAGTLPDLKREPPATPSAPDLHEKTQPVVERSQAALTAAEPSTRTSKRKDGANKSKSEMSGPTGEGEQPIIPEDPVVPDMLDLIRAEIKGRLPYFQACADSARRRSGLEVHRLQATWFINADGTIKEFRLDEAPDAPLADCLIRAGRRPFPIQPGLELTIPTPIVFVR
jgi:hypothetical protein